MSPIPGLHEQPKLTKAQKKNAAKKRGKAAAASQLASGPVEVEEHINEDVINTTDQKQLTTQQADDVTTKSLTEDTPTLPPSPIAAPEPARTHFPVNSNTTSDDWFDGSAAGTADSAPTTSTTTPANLGITGLQLVQQYGEPTADPSPLSDNSANVAPNDVHQNASSDAIQRNESQNTDHDLVNQSYSGDHQQQRGEKRINKESSDANNEAGNKRSSRNKDKKKKKSRFEDADPEEGETNHHRGGQPTSNIPGLSQSATSGKNIEDEAERKIVDEMKSYIKNPKKGRLDHYQGYVYLFQLAEVMHTPELELNKMLHKYSSEFDSFSDDSNYVNVGIQRERESDTKLSRMLAGLLRHRAEDKGFDFMEGGYLYVKDIFKRPQFKGYTEEDIERIVKNNDKQRFGLKRNEKSGLMIRANQGHSIARVNAIFLGLPEVNGKDVPCCVHGTYHEKWEIIRATGLKAMARNEIHFAQGEPGESGVISGMRSTCEVLIFVDMDKAIADGIKFYRSENKVILSEGDRNRCIPTKYFSKVMDRRSRTMLPFTSERPRHDSKTGSRDNSPASKRQHSSASTNQQQDKKGDSAPAQQRPEKRHSKAAANQQQDNRKDRKSKNST